MSDLHFVAIGSNLPAFGGTAQSACVWAAQRLASEPAVRAASISRWYSSAPVPASAQPRFINGVLRFTGVFSPAMLLTMLQRLEAQAGRVRAAQNSARTLDLDIIDMGGQVRDAPDPVLPHPRAHMRAFVLLPLRDVAPHWVHPRLGAPVQALIDQLPAQDILPA